MLPYNFQLALLTSLLKLNDFEDAELIIETVWEDFKLDFTVVPDLLSTVSSLILRMLQDLSDDHHSPDRSNTHSK